MSKLALAKDPKSVDASLWFDSFAVLLTELENAPLSSSLPSTLVEKLKEYHGWFLETVNRFKPPNQTSKESLNSQQISIGSHILQIRPELKKIALKLSSTVCLDEVQSYIIAERCLRHDAVAADGVLEGSFHELVLQYYIERQCLLKCTRQLITHALHIEAGVDEGKFFWDKASQLISDGMESKLISILEGLLQSSHSEQLDVELLILWAEELLIEENVVLDILFLLYYDSFCICDAEKWKKLCLIYKGMVSGSFSFGKLGVSAEAVNYCYEAKVQMLLILVETLDFENLLQMIHNEMSLRDGAGVFSLCNILEMDAVVSSFDVFETKEAGPLVLAWAVFVCLIISLPRTDENYELAEIDHVSYVRQAFEAGSLGYFLQILQSDVLKDSDGPVAGYWSISRTFISAFIASYEITVELEDNTLRLLLNILCEIYRGEESLCTQFWDRDSIVDGPVRCLLCSLEREFPYRTIELIRILSALCEGNWPAQCVYNFLDKSAGVSSQFELTNDNLVDEVSQIVELPHPLQIPGIDGLIVPCKTRGHVLRMIGRSTAVVRWEHKQSGLLILLLRLAHELDLDGKEEVVVILELFSRLVSSSMAVCFQLMNISKPLQGQGVDSNRLMEETTWPGIVEVVCNLVRNVSPNCTGAQAMSMGVNILTKMLKCSPSHVSSVVMKMNIFDLSMRTSIFSMDSSSITSGSWLLSGRLAKMLLIDCELNNSCPLTISVVNFTIQFLEAGVENDFVLALVIFCLQYVLVNHEFWKYKVKQDRWSITLKVFGLLKACTSSIPYHPKIDGTICDIILSDGSIHDVLFRILCTTSPALEKLYNNRLYDAREVEGLQVAIVSVLDILIDVLSNFSLDNFSSMPVLHQAMLSSSTKPIPVVTALISLVPYTRKPEIQLRAATLLAMLCKVAYHMQPYLFGSSGFTLGDKQVIQLRYSIENVISEQFMRSDDLFVATFKLLTCAAQYQPALLAAIFAAEDVTATLASNDGGPKILLSESSFHPLRSKNATLLVDKFMSLVETFENFMKSNPQKVLSILCFLKALWEGAAQYADILERLRKHDKFWKQLSRCISLVTDLKDTQLKHLTVPKARSLAEKYSCLAAALDIIALDMFLQQKLLHTETLVKKTGALSNERDDGASIKTPDMLSLRHLKDILPSSTGSSLFNDLVMPLATCIYDTDICLHAKISSGLLAAHFMWKLSAGDSGSLSLSFIEKTNLLSTKLMSLPSFSELLSLYSRHCYSGTELKTLIFSDLYFHLQGELEGRSIDPGPFKELSQFLLNSDYLRTYQKKDHSDAITEENSLYLFDLVELQKVTGLDVWDYTEWNTSKETAEIALHKLQDFNSMLQLMASRQSSLRALIIVLSLNKEHGYDSSEGGSPRDSILSCIDHVCQEFDSTLELLIGDPDASERVLEILCAQAELLLCLLNHACGNISLPICNLLLKISRSGLKALTESSPLGGKAKLTMKFLLLSLLMVVESGCCSISLPEANGSQSSGELANSYLGLLPVLCKCSEISDHCILSLATINLILKSFVSPNAWLPIIQKHLQLQHAIQKLTDTSLLEYCPRILKFLLTLARVRGGAEMLLASGFLSSVRKLFNEVSDGMLYPVERINKIENPPCVWGLVLTIITAMICSLGESSGTADVINFVISYIFFEKAYLIAYHLSAPEFPTDAHDKKRLRAHNRQTCLSELRETEHTLTLICVLAMHRSSWAKSMKEMESELRERSIHLLAFISKGSQSLEETPTRTVPLICLPVYREDFEGHKRAAFVKSKSGWFSLSPLGCLPRSNASTEATKTTALAIKDQAAESPSSSTQTYFSDTVAVQMYRIAFLLLRFLCLQAHNAARRAEQLGFLDVAHFPELPMPEILHGLQDQAISIVTDVCEAHKSTQIPSEVQGVCLLLLEIVEMALHLELCVSQICGIRPLLGRIEDFSKEIRSLVRGTEAHAFLKPSMKHVKQVISFVYPGLLQSEGIL